MIAGIAAKFYPPQNLGAKFILSENKDGCYQQKIFTTIKPVRPSGVNSTSITAKTKKTSILGQKNFSVAREIWCISYVGSRNASF